jgi:hypothetical protein
MTHLGTKWLLNQLVNLWWMLNNAKKILIFMQPVLVSSLVEEHRICQQTRSLIYIFGTFLFLIFLAFVRDFDSLACYLKVPMTER